MMGIFYDWNEEEDDKEYEEWFRKALREIHNSNKASRKVNIKVESMTLLEQASKLGQACRFTMSKEYVKVGLDPKDMTFAPITIY